MFHATAMQITLKTFYQVQSWDVFHRSQLYMEDTGSSFSSSFSSTGNNNKIKRGYRGCRTGRKVKER